jgi:hypothetical protein
MTLEVEAARIESEHRRNRIMLTLKIIHTSQDGGRTTHIFTGERMSHTEIEKTTHYNSELTSDELLFFIVGELADSSSTQPYVMSNVTIFNGNDYQTVFILPASECFVMANGKTVDSFSTYYK